METTNEFKENIHRSRASGTSENEFRNEPIVETQISKSKDGKYVLHKTIITDIKPVGYYQKVIGGE
ncbi:MAG: hypothetical protein Q8Q01_05475 [archaeon]|nr:hypothetical protein [archaeon]